MSYQWFGSLLAGSLALSVCGAYQIRLPENPAPAEQSAADTLRYYLQQSATTLSVDGNDDVVFHVGDTPVARNRGLAANTLEDEAWRVKSFGGDVVITGGGSRGTLYAVSHFLEDGLGVRFLAPGKEYVPEARPVKLEALDWQGKPFFMLRDLYRGSVVADDGRFSVLRRMNRDGDNTITAAYGGSMNFGSPYFVHTCDWLIPAAEYLESHPEYFSLRDGKRVGGQTVGQLCLSNPEMRKLYLQRLLEFIRRDEEKARAAGVNPPAIYDVSNNDNPFACQCDVCQALAQATGGEAGVLVDFLNEISDGVRAIRPDIYISTLAYFQSENPPTIAPRDNIIIRLCDTRTNQAQPFSKQSDRHFVDRLEAWSKIAGVLGIWDYAITYTATGFPYPHEYTLAENLRTYAGNKVKFMFYEHENPETADMFDLGVYLETRLFEDPNADFEALRRDFLEKYYGAAAPFIDTYRQLVKRSADAHNNFIDWFAEMPSHFSHMDAATVLESQRQFDQAEAAVATDAELLRRVRRARLNLDRITYAGDGYLSREWAASGHGAWPLDKAEVLERARRSWQESIDDVMAQAPETVQSYRAEMEETMRKELAFQAALPRLPLATFADAPWGETTEVFDIPADMARLRQDNLAVVADAGAQGGWAVKMVPKAGEHIVLPVTGGFYNNQTSGGYDAIPIALENIPGAGYHWYKVGDIRLEPTMYAHYFEGWPLFLPLAPAADRYPDAPAEVWVRCKFTGPNVPGGQSGDEEAVWLERQVIVPRP